MLMSRDAPTHDAAPCHVRGCRCCGRRCDTRACMRGKRVWSEWQGGRWRTFHIWRRGRWQTRERRRGGSASARATRAKSGAPIIPTTGDGDGDGDGASLDAIFAPLRECWWSYAMGTVEGCGGDERGRAEAARRVAQGDARGAVATVSSCRDPGLTGTRGTIVRDTARTLWMVEVGNRNKVVKVPKRGTTFEVEAPAPKRGNSSDTSGGNRSGPGGAHGGGAPTMTVTVRGDNLARVG